MPTKTVIQTKHETRVTKSPNREVWHVLCTCGFKGQWRDSEVEANDDAEIHTYWEETA